jgi:hypothetical protein
MWIGYDIIYSIRHTLTDQSVLLHHLRLHFQIIKNKNLEVQRFSTRQLFIMITFFHDLDKQFFERSNIVT